MNWIETIIKEYEDILNIEFDLQDFEPMYRVLVKKCLHKGLCFKVRNNIKERDLLEKYLDLIGVSGYIISPPNHIALLNKKDRYSRLRKSIQCRLTHLYKMKELYYPTKISK